MNTTVQTIFGLLGGLAIFIYGMNLMSEGLQKAAGEKMKTILGILTRNPIMGVLAGALVTSVLQSSSATTVMVIGFVSAGLMSLPQAISVIMGANIGTTMTAQIIAFKISDYIWPILFIGFIISFVVKNEKIKNIGQTIFAFGLLFTGIETMGSTMKPLASSEFFVNMIGQVSHIPVLGLGLGTLMTVVVQSSSATIAVLQNFAAQPAADGVHSLIGLTGAIPILLGDNIGTTITALLACIGQSKNAKRTAIAHSVFNVTGSVVFMCIIPWFAKFVQWISPAGNEIDVIARQIANAHTTFNIANTLVWLPLIWLMVKIVTTIIPGDEKETNAVTGALVYIDENIKGQPVVALHLIQKELIHMSEQAVKMLNDAKAMFTDKNVDNTEILKEAAESLHQIQEKADKYMAAQMSEGVLTTEQAEQLSMYLCLTNEFERIGANGYEAAKAYADLKNKGGKFSKDAKKEIDSNISEIASMLTECRESLETGNTSAAERVLDKKNIFHSMNVKMMRGHMERLKKGKCNPGYTAAFSTVLYSLERMSNSCNSVAEMLKEDMRPDVIEEVAAEAAQRNLIAANV